MGIVNVTPDSFSDGGLAANTDTAVAHALKLIAEGADILDIGGESTRPGAVPVPVEEEARRVLPVIVALSAQTNLPLSIDTRHPDVAQAAIEHGASLWNDIMALGEDGALATAAALQVPVILMHMQGEPQSMQTAPHYEDVASEVETWLLARAAVAEQAGLGRDRIWLDPGIGFGKTLAHNMALMQALPRLRAHGYPVLLAASRKRFIGEIDKTSPAPDQRIGGSIASVLHAARTGCEMVRVHDVAASVQALDVWARIEGRA
jgi:dihydropteroate synthase